MPTTNLTSLTRVLRKPPRLIVQRALTEFNAQTDRYRAPRRARRFASGGLLAATAAETLDALWMRLAERLHAVPIRSIAPADCDRLCPGDSQRIFHAAGQAMMHRVDFLGTGPIDLGTPIEWHTDFKTGRVFTPTYMRDIDYTNLACPSDVKVPWEVSRLQWMIPVGQAYLLTGDERYAAAARQVLDDWIAANPYAHSVNWACTMEVAMRIISWTWLFHVFCRSAAWADRPFRARFAQMLFLHGEFTERYIERSDINGNHFTADAAALVFAGLFFGAGEAPLRWASQGWQMLCDELPRQVHPDGVDFEASLAYHRLVAELFFFAARYREALGLDVPDAYRERVIAMARFIQAYSRPDGRAPLVGDADDARVLPFGGQDIRDHRYLAGIIGAHWCVKDLMQSFSGPRTEVMWTLGRGPAMSLPDGTASTAPASTRFAHGGFYVLCNTQDHVFIDCGPVGQAGRGGHGHNDCLSFEAVLAGVPLVSDCGAYVYTASAVERNHFRSTAYHNTPGVDGEEINRFIRWDYLWTLHNDAAPEVRAWETGPERDTFAGSHTGYARLDGAPRPVRRFCLNHRLHALTIEDTIEGAGGHAVAIPLHLAPGVSARILAPGEIALDAAGGRRFVLRWSGTADWTVEIGPARISPSYGVIVPAVRLLWRSSGPLPFTLTMHLAPQDAR